MVDDDTMAMDHKQQHHDVVNDDDDDDDDLQAAIALSMQQQQQQQESAPGSGESGGNDNHHRHNDVAIRVEEGRKPPPESLPSMITTATSKPISNASYSIDSGNITGGGGGGGYFDCKSFYKLMWDDATTTTNDKERWIYECISTPSLLQQQQQTISSNDNGGNSDIPQSTAAASSASAKTNINEYQNFQALTPLQVFAKPPPPPSQPQNETAKQQQSSPPQILWGLTQKHGGPCGVLAAIQAEMIRILLFGRGNSSRELFYPWSPQSCVNYEGSAMAPIHEREVKEALGMSVGMILARAALAPSLLDSNSEEMTGRRGIVHLVLPTGDDKCTGTTSTNPVWIQEMLTGNNNNNNAAESGSGSGLRVHSITTAPEDAELKNIHSAGTNEESGDKYEKEDDDASPEMKRPRGNNKEARVSFAFDPIVVVDSHITTSSKSTSMEVTMEQKRLAALARSVADYLLLLSNNSTNNGTLNNEGGGGAPLDYFMGPGGVMFLVMSLVKTRGMERIKSDMDDPNTTITSQFGHSSQELMNLLLTGQAVSNVFDNSMTLSEDLTCKGIQSRPAVGYLSMLESLRYCEVGGYYKSPLFPIWVVGSTSHFSVLFGDEQCLKESKSDMLLEKCRRAFKKVEGGGENGFIQVDKLGEVMDELDLTSKIGGEIGVQTLKAYLEVSGAGIILWDDFWKATSRLMTGSSIESIMSSQDDMMQVDNVDDDMPPLLITQFGEEDKAMSAAAVATTPPPAAATASAAASTTTTAQSDEELARKLAEEWGTAPEVYNQSGDMNAMMDAWDNPGGPGDKSDEDYARALQAEWDAEVAGTDGAASALIDLSSQAATTDDVATLASVADRPPTPIPDRKMPAGKEDTKPAASPMDAETKTPSNESTGDQASSNARLQLDFEKHGLSFDLYHYNGLYGGTLTPFRLTRLSPTEAVGASIALSSKGGGSGHGANGDLEDVVRTKWPSSMVNWFGKQPPSID